MLVPLWGPPRRSKPIPLLKTTGRRRLIPNLEQVTCREPTVTPIKLGDLLSALSSLNEIPDLLESLRRKLYLSSTSWGLRGKLFGLHHFCIPSGTAPVSRDYSGPEVFRLVARGVS